MCSFIILLSLACSFLCGQQLPQKIKTPQETRILHDASIDIMLSHMCQDLFFDINEEPLPFNTQVCSIKYPQLELVLTQNSDDSYTLTIKTIFTLDEYNDSSKVLPDKKDALRTMLINAFYTACKEAIDSHNTSNKPLSELKSTTIFRALGESTQCRIKIVPDLQFCLECKHYITAQKRNSYLKAHSKE